MKNFTKTLMLLCVAVSFSANNALAQFGCGSAVALTNGYTAAGITTPGAGGPEDWNVNPTGTSITSSYWDDDVYLFEYTAGGTAEQISMTIFTRNSWNGIGIFDDCTGSTFSTELDADGSSAGNISRTVSATIAAGNTVYIAVGQWGTPNDLDFDVTAFTVAPISCPDPSFGVATNVTATSADIGWTENGTSTSWNIEWGVAGFTPTGTPTIAGTSNNPEPLTGLTADSGYEFYVQSDCGGSGTSGWAGPFSFSTPCATITPDYLEAFASFVPTCWEEAGNGDLASGPTALGVGEWGHTDFVNAGGANNAAKVNLYNTGSNEWILSPLFDLSAGGYELRYNVGVTTYNGTGSITMGSDDQVQVLYTTDGGATWTNLETYDASNSPSNTGDAVTLDISAITGTSVQFAIWATEGTVDDPEDYDFHVTNFEVRTPPSCVEPTALTATNITATTADLGWTENGTATTWNIEWGVAGFTPTGTPTITGTSNNPESLTGLTDNTAYEFYVQADCGGSGTSGWTGPFSFATPCAVFTPDYLESFAAFTPTCWEQNTGPITGPTGTAGSSSWGHTDFANAGGADNAAKINLYTTSPADWLMSPSFDLSAGGYELKYDVAVTSYNGTGVQAMGADDQVQVIYTTDNGATWTNLATYNTGNTPSNTGDAITIDISAITGTNVQFAIWADEGAVNDPEDFDFHFTNFQIRTPPACLEPSALTATNITATTADLGWTENGTATSWNIEWGAAGFTPTGTPTIAGTPNNPESLTGLTDNTAYEFYVQADCGGSGTSTWVGPFAFSTPCAPFDGDDAATPIVITGLTVSTTGNTSQCFTDQSAGGGFSHDAPDAWYEYTLDICTDSLIVSLCGSAFDTYLTIYANDGTTVIATNDDNFGACGSGGNSYLELDLNATAGIAGGDLIYIVVDGYNSSQGVYDLNVTQIESPTAVIDAQTACDSLLWNGTTYTASGQYDWLGTDVNGCDSLVTLDLTISNATVGTDVITACDSLIWVDGITYYASINTPTFTLTNSAGCDSTLTLDLTIIPNAAPVADSTSLPDVTDECSVASITAPTATDACSGVITGTPDVTFPITTQGTTVVTWTFDDGAGLTSTQTQNVIITDVTPPTASNPPTLTVQCIGDVPQATPGSVTDEADNCGTPVVAFVSEVSDGQTCPETLTRTFSVTDEGGNSITVTQTIIVNDNVNPILDATSLPTETGFCDVTPTAPTATDNCAGTIDGVADVTFPINTPGTTTVTWTFTDDCGNSVTQTQDVVIEDIDVSTSFAGDGITILASNNDPGVTYQWYNCTEDTVMTGETNFNFTPTFSADFAVIITQDGCVDTSACVTITEVGIEAILLNSVEVYPNPVSDFVNVDLAGLENAHVRLLDMSGKVLRDEACKTTQLFTMEMNEAPGAYIIEVQSNEFVRQFKLIKE